MKLCTILLPAVISICVVVSGCNTNSCGSSKADFIQNYTQFIENISAHRPQQWDDSDRQLQQFVKECYPTYKNDLTLEERKDVWIGVVRYLYNKYGLGLALKMSDLGDLRDDIAKNLEELNLDLQEILQTIAL